MKNFSCQNCGDTIHFNNDSCLSCGLKIGYLAELFEMTALVAENGAWKARWPILRKAISFAITPRRLPAIGWLGLIAVSTSAWPAAIMSLFRT